MEAYTGMLLGGLNQYQQHAADGATRLRCMLSVEANITENIMPIFNPGFSAKLIDAAQFVLSDDGDEYDKLQTVLYLSYLSCEITLKALLEKAGKPIKGIKACSHDFEKIFHFFIVEVEIYDEVANNIHRWRKASRIGCEQTRKGIYEPTVRTMLTNKKASQYPSNLRYAGDHISAYPPQELIKAAKILLDDAHKYWDNIRLAP